MKINLWKKYPKRKPKENGVYLCTCSGVSGKYVIDLYFDTIEGGKWIDKRRQNVFDGYKVYAAGRPTMEYNRVWSDGLCERDNVIAWKEMPRAYKSRKGRGKK